MTKRILITGSTDGIGKLAAIKLAKEGHHIYLHGRRTEKLALSVEEITKESGNEHVEGFVADFSDLDAVSRMAKQIMEKIPVLDVLINNAGVYKSDNSHNINGLDMRVVVNYLAPFLLTNLILPAIRRSEGPRIINLSSRAQSSISEPVISGEVQVSQSAAYAQSKLALTMWSFDLAAREKDIVVIAVNPGSLLNTKMVKEAFGEHWSSAEKGSNILSELAVSPDYESDSGKYFDNDKGEVIGMFSQAHADAYDKDKIEDLKRMTEEVINNL